MKIYRSGRTSKNWDITDTRPLAKWAKDWQPGKQLQVDGTIQKDGRRHTDFGIELESRDIAALHNAYQRFLKRRLRFLEKREKLLSEEVKMLKTGLEKISRLVVFHKEKAPSPQELLDSVREIARYFRYSHLRKTPLKFKWIKLKSI